jgi:glycerate 2-kinase
VPPTILIAPDKFKGTLTARAAAVAIARGWTRNRPGDSLRLLPVSDGGDGFGQVMGELLTAKARSVRTVDAAHRRCRSRWWWEPKTRTAVIESANVVGLAMLPPGKFHPFDLDTFGLGAVVRAAASRGARRCLIGIGGSATNDGGFGLARALGWEFLDRDGKPIPCWTGLPKLSRIIAPKRRHWFHELIVAVDVQNPLLGVRGATRIYGPQKGIRRGEFAFAESCLERLAKVFEQQFGSRMRLHAQPGTGAAGGLGFGLLAFMGARVEPGFDLFARFAKLDQLLRSADLAITGEGRIDASTFMGKGAGQVARRCRARKIPCLALAGVIAGRARFARDFRRVRALTDLTTLRQALARPGYWLERLAAQCAAEACEPGQ